jgi:hypothetical protein
LKFARLRCLLRLLLFTLPALGLLGGCATLSADRVLRKKMYKWTKIETQDYNLYIQSPSYADSAQDVTSQLAQKAYKSSLKTLLLPQYPKKLQLFVINSREDMHKLTGVRGNGSAFPSTQMAIVVRSAKIDALTCHELIHVMAINSWGRTESWINEGLAVYADSLWWGQSIHSIAHYLYKKDLLPPVKQMFSYFRDVNSLISYPMTGSFCKYLISEYGMESFKMLWKKGHKQLPTIYGKSVEELEADWKKVIQKESLLLVRYPEL